MSGYSAPLACVMVCVGVYWGMRMYMPSVMRVLMGERNDVDKQRKKTPHLFSDEEYFLEMEVYFLQPF